VKRLESVCEGVLNGRVTEGAAVVLEKLGINVVRAVLGLPEAFLVDVELKVKPGFGSGGLYAPVISVRLMIAKPERLPTQTRMLASRSFFEGSVSATGSYSAQLAASLQIGPSAVCRDCKGSSLPPPSTFKTILSICSHDPLSRYRNFGELPIKMNHARTSLGLHMRFNTRFQGYASRQDSRFPLTQNECFCEPHSTPVLTLSFPYYQLVFQVYLTTRQNPHY
jgi:hypothetical protein